MTFRSIARGAAVASSIVLFSGYVWYRSGAETERADQAERVAGAPSERVAEAQAMPVNNVGPGATLFEKNAGTGDLTLVDEAFANAEGDPGTGEPKAGYVFSVMTGQGASGPGGSKTYIVTNVMSSSKSMTLGYALSAQPAPPPPAQATPAKPEPPEQKRKTLLSGSKSERVALPLPSSTEEAAPAPAAKPSEAERRVLMPGSKSADLLPNSAMPGAIVQSREAPQTSAVQEAPPAPVKKKRRVLMSSSKSKPVEWVEVEDEKTDAPSQQQQEQRRAGEDGQ